MNTTKNLNRSENPWLGLKSYSEGKKIYGRDKEIEELSQKILYNTQTIIYGRSGIGKSSLLKAGVFPILRRNGYFPVYVRFVHEEGQGNYTNQIITAIEESLTRLKIEDLSAPDSDMYKIVQGYKVEVVPVNNVNREECLWEYFHRHQFFYKLHEEGESHPIVPILIFDQFEEIFTLQKDENIIKKFFDELAGLLNNVCPKYLLQSTFEVEKINSLPGRSSLIKKGLIQREKRWDYIDETNLHIVLSLREDFLSYLERNIEHIPSLKHNRYCLLPLNEDQAAEVIMQPVPGLISVEVAKDIISKVTGVSPCKFEIDDNPELEVDSAILSLFLSELYVRKGDDANISRELVELFGTNIISDFYEKTVGDRNMISESSIRYLEKRLVTRDERRDSIFKEQALRNGVSDEELHYLIACRLLHQYPWRDGIRIEFSHDVLCPIVIERRKTREEILEKQRLHETYLKMKKEKQRLMYVLLLTFFSIFFAALFIYDGWFDVKVQRYAQIIKERTWMKGLKPLSKHEASYLNYHYVFYKTGRWAEYPDSVEARNGYDELTPDHNTGTYLVNHLDHSDNHADATMVNKLKNVVKWVLESDKTQKFCIQEKAFDKDGKLIFSFNNSKKENDSVFISTYVDEYGFPIIMRDSCYIYLRTTMDKQGREILQEFFNDKGFPVMNKDGAFQTARDYFPNGVQKYEASLFLNGHRMIDRVENCGWEILELAENGIDGVLSIYFDADEKPCRINDGTMFKRSEYDEHGRVIKETYWQTEYTGENKDIIKLALEEQVIELQPDTNIYGVHGYVQKFNRHGQDTLFYAIDISGNPIKASNRDFVKIRRQYDDKGHLIEEFGVDENGNNIWEQFVKYTTDDKISFQKSYYLITNSDTLMNYHLYWDKSKNRKIEKNYFNDGYYTYKEFDTNDRILMEARYETNTDYPIGDTDGLHKTIIEYEYDKEHRRLIQTKHYFNKDGNICGYAGKSSYFKEVTIIDSLLHTQTAISYTTADVFASGVDTSPKPIEILYRGIERLYNSDFTIPLAETSLDIHGDKCRTYENGAYYYQVKYIKSILPSHAEESHGYYALNEFGEPSLIRNQGNLYSTYYDHVQFDEYGHKIEDEELNRPLFAAIETQADIGFNSGDILVQQDNWIWWKSGSFDNLDLEPQPNIEHHFKVLRFNESTKEYDVVEINIPKGDERVTKIEYKKFYMTKAEEKRVHKTMSDKVYGHMFEFVPYENAALYERGMHSAALVLSVNDWDMTSHYGGVRDSFINVLKQQIKDVNHVVVYDEELEEVQTYVVDCDTFGVYINSYNVKPGYYELLKEKMLQNKNKATSSYNDKK